MLMSKREHILHDLEEGMMQADVARKHEVSEAYVSQLVRREETKQKVKNFDFLKGLIERGAIEIKTFMMSEEEVRRLEEM